MTYGKTTRTPRYRIETPVTLFGIPLWWRTCEFSIQTGAESMGIISTWATEDEAVGYAYRNVYGVWRVVED